MLHKTDLLHIMEDYPREQREIRKEADQKQIILDRARKVIEESVQELEEEDDSLNNEVGEEKE